MAVRHACRRGGALRAGQRGADRHGNDKHGMAPALRGQMIRRLFRAILVLAVLGGFGLVGYAYLGDIAPEPRDIRVPVTLNGQ
jgi:hypothetical protein